MHGMRNISNVPLAEMLADRFASTDLENKHVNIDSELSNATIRNASILKKLTDRSLVRISAKIKEQTIRLTAKLFFCDV